MGSVYSAVKCLCCGRSAFKDYYYLKQVKNIFFAYGVVFYKKEIKSETAKILLSNSPENFYLPFEEYKRKMFAKYELLEDEFMVPLEE
ncbi:MAG: hypothetical protein ABTA16_01095 [Niallia sp.]